MRIATVLRGGVDVLLDLDKPLRLEDGDALRFDNGRLVCVAAAE